MDDISLDDYFGPYATHPDAIPGKWAVADLLLDKVNALLKEAEEDGVYLEENPITRTLISGSGNGGFRPMDCKVGHPLSAHKGGHAVDIFDAYEQLDEWIRSASEPVPASARAAVYYLPHVGADRFAHRYVRVCARRPQLNR